MFRWQLADIAVLPRIAEVLVLVVRAEDEETQVHARRTNPVSLVGGILVGLPHARVASAVRVRVQAEDEGRIPRLYSTL